jgi:hypothetical protein
MMALLEQDNNADESQDSRSPLLMSGEEGVLIRLLLEVARVSMGERTLRHLLRQMPVRLGADAAGCWLLLLWQRRRTRS